MTATIPQPEAVTVADLVRLANCPHCWQRPGKPCTIAGPNGDHLTGWQRAERRGLITRACCCAGHARSHRRSRDHPRRCAVTWNRSAIVAALPVAAASLFFPLVRQGVVPEDGWGRDTTPWSHWRLLEAP